MKFVQAQFSLKFEPHLKIRRKANDIEDCLQGYYGTPQTMPLPDDFAADAPRIVLNSKNGHSQISFSQISVDFMVNFDNDYVDDFELTKTYIFDRLRLLKTLLQSIDINNFYYMGLTYNTHLMEGEGNVEYMEKLLGDQVGSNQDIYEASRRIAYVHENTYFINEQIGIFKEYQGNNSGIPNLLNFINSRLVNEGINLMIDVNNRYHYLINGDVISIDRYDDTINNLYCLIEEQMKKWS